jgi:DNA-binding XRE family transcriptional regulator
VSTLRGFLFLFAYTKVYTYLWRMKSIRIPKETKQALRKLVKAKLTKTATAEYLGVHRLTLSNLLERETCDPKTLTDVNKKLAEWNS